MSQAESGHRIRTGSNFKFEFGEPVEVVIENIRGMPPDESRAVGAGDQCERVMNGGIRISCDAFLKQFRDPGSF